MNDAPTPSRPLSSLFPPGQTTEAFKAYGADIGYLAINWNRLHDNLAKVFEHVIKSKSPKVASAVWYSTDSDFSQRNMLRAATEKSTHLTDQQRESILWVLNKIDKSLRHGRNDVIHAPIVVVRRFTARAIEAPEVRPDKRSDSPRAKSLSGKNLKEEFAKYTDLCRTLSTYTSQMYRSFHQPEHYPWPDKPPLPQAHRKKNQKG